MEISKHTGWVKKNYILEMLYIASNKEIPFVYLTETIFNIKKIGLDQL